MDEAPNGIDPRRGNVRTGLGHFKCVCECLDIITGSLVDSANVGVKVRRPLEGVVAEGAAVFTQVERFFHMSVQGGQLCVGAVALALEGLVFEFEGVFFQCFAVFEGGSAVWGCTSVLVVEAR